MKRILKWRLGYLLARCQNMDGKIDESCRLPVTSFREPIMDFRQLGVAPKLREPNFTVLISLFMTWIWRFKLYIF
ncbi:hypothetical protein A4H97_16825 [Niastella yeongjuensis]|uniref:Uncharacterized protein n=1 Tax=Niastella yeongjuensis TaxID=354355 RepID=A0A1V9E174_9BACT|nr:hypothetical protein A4H97_16825 [Niastella yeongjuensis]